MLAAGSRRHTIDLPRAEALRLLGQAAIGRVMYTARALPAVRLVTHLVDGDDIIFRTAASAPIIARQGAGTDTIVGYEADMIDPHDRLGWSVTVTGTARLVTDQGRIDACRQALTLDVHGGPDQIIVIRASIVTGFRIVADPVSSAGSP